MNESHGSNANQHHAARQEPRADEGDPNPDPAIMRRLLGADPLQRVHGDSDDDFYGGRDLLWSMEAGPEDLRATARELPALKGKSWWLTKQVQTFAVQEMRDLEFEPAVPLLARELRTAAGSGPAHCLAQFGARALPIALAGGECRPVGTPAGPLDRGGGGWPRRPTRLEDPSQESEPKPWDSRLATPLLKLLSDDDARIRELAGNAAAANWDTVFVPRLTDLLRDSDEQVREAALFSLRQHEADLTAQLPAYRKMVEEDGPAAPKAMMLLSARRDDAFTREQLLRLLFSPTCRSLDGGRKVARTVPSTQRVAQLLQTRCPSRACWVSAPWLAVAKRRPSTASSPCCGTPMRPSAGWCAPIFRRITGQKLGADPAAWRNGGRKTRRRSRHHHPGRAGLRRN